MPMCKKCDNQFPNRIEIDGKSKILKSRSYCLECSPWKERKGYSLRKENNEDNPKNTTKHCKICDREYPTNKNNVCSSCRSLYRRKQVKAKAIEMLGGKCSKCEEDDLRTLTFHHLFPLEKKFELSIAWGSKDWNEIKEELKSCEILCSNCHLKEHSADDEKLKRICEYYESSEAGSLTG